MPPALSAWSPPQQRSLIPQAVPAPVGLAPLDAPHRVVVGREAPERVELEGAVGLAHALQRGLGEQVPDGHGACGTRPMAIRSCPAAAEDAQCCGIRGSGTGRGCRSCEAAGPGFRAGQAGSGTAGPAWSCRSPQARHKSDRWGSSQSHVLEPTGMRGCSWLAHDKCFSCPGAGRGSCAVPAPGCCSP